jgi:hypothetical protein
VFLYGNPVPPEQFVGRRRELRHVSSRIAFHGQSTAIIGEPRCGKTSLLNYLASDRGRDEVQKLSSVRLVFSYLDAHTLPDRLDHSQFWERLLEPVRDIDAGPQQHASGDSGILYGEKTFYLQWVEAVLGRVRAAGVRLVVLIDEFDVLVHQRVADPSVFFGALRSLTTRSGGALTLVLASRSPLGTLDEVAQRYFYIGSPYFNFVSEVNIAPLSTEDVDSILDLGGDRFSAEERRNIHELSGGHPYLVQAAAGVLWHAEHSDPRKRRLVAEADLMRETSRTLADIWRRWPPATRYVFATVALEQLNALHATGAAGNSFVNADAFGFELDSLCEQGFVATDADTPSRRRVKPLLLLAWWVGERRKEASSSARWQAWLDTEEWAGSLPTSERRFWIEQAARIVTGAKLELYGENNLRPGVFVDRARNSGIVVDRSPASQPSIEQAPASTRERRMLRFLQFTDWHVGMAEQGWLWPNVREVLLDDLTRIHERLGGIDAVFFTGDLTQRGSPAEFDVLDRELDLIWAHLDRLGSDPLLVAVPGNHDLTRPARRSPVVKALSAWHTDTEIRDEFWSHPDGDYQRCVREAFAPYSAWAERRTGARSSPRSGLLPGDAASVIERSGLRVGIVGLNSAFLQLTDADYERKLDLDIRQVNAVCGGDAPEWLRQNDVNFLLTHHGPEWLEPTRKKHFETEIAPPGRFALHLHGHMHEPSTRTEAVGGSRSRHRLQGASLFGLERILRPGGIDEERLHGYTACSVEIAWDGESASGGTRMQLWPRRMITKQSGLRVIERDGEFELGNDESLLLEAPLTRRGPSSELRVSRAVSAAGTVTGKSR